MREKTVFRRVAQSGVFCRGDTVARIIEKVEKRSHKKEGRVKSPCVKKCSLDNNRICPQCYRSIEEIVAWPDIDDATRKKVLAAAKLRRASSQQAPGH